MSSQVKLLLPKFHRNRTLKYNNTAIFSPKPSPPRKNKQTLEEEEGELEDGVLDKGTSDRVWKRSNLVHSKSGACAF